MKIGFYKCSTKKGRNSEYKIHMMYNYDKDWPEASLAKRGLCGNRFFVREATQEEEKEASSQPRALCYRYKSIEDLIEDEQRCGINKSVIKSMIMAYGVYVSWEEVTGS